MMKAVWFSQFGPAKDVLIYGEQEIIPPQKGEVQVRLATSAVNPSDVKKRMGSGPNLLDNGFVIPNSDGAGTIEAVGEGVDPAKIGQRVWIYNGQYGRRFGTSAEYITVDEKQAVFLPDTASFAVGACMGIPAMTAHRCVMADGSVEGKIILVTGGAGRVGHYAIQFAKSAGATVIATASSPASRKECVEAGADCVVEHPSSAANEALLAFTDGRKVDRVVEGDFGKNLPYVLEILATNGTIATYASMSDPQPTIPFYRMMFMDINVRLVLVYAMSWEAKSQAMEDITSLLEKDALTHRIAATYPLAESAAAHEAIEQGNQYGCVVLKM
ncbi:MAG: NADPH:quinone reductase [Bacteroidota bacterium]